MALAINLPMTKKSCTHKPPRHWRNHDRDYAKQKRRFLWGRFIGFFLFFAIPLLIVGGFVGMVFRTDNFQPHMMSHAPIGALICLVPIFVIGLLLFLGTRAFRRMGTPLADVMSAADAVAEGDLSVHVPERGPGEIRRLAESFNRMVSELASADQQRRNMTADVAHELRTPIHVLRGNLEGMLDGVYDATPEQLNAMLEETRLLTRLVDDLQTISLAEAGQLPLYFAKVDIAELLADVQTSFSVQAEDAGVELILDIQDADMVIEADADRLDQVLGNLVGNALRHTPAEGWIRLQAESSSNGVRLQIRDEGQGIPPEDLPFIFDRFYRADKSRSRKGGGSGLGLAIARELIRLHGGEISVKSELGKGTTFIIDLPRQNKS